MKCPLLSIAYPKVQGTSPGDLPLCLGSECAWWDDEIECCVMMSLASELMTALEYLGGIRDKMPPAGQSLK
ncbi:hypothetical protein ES708_30246 [subsurface metagenome]